MLLVVSLKAKCQFYRNSRLALDIRSIVGHCHKGQILAHIDIIQRGRVCTGDTVFLIGINDERSARVRRFIVAAEEIDEPDIFALTVIRIVGFYGVVSRLHFPRVSLNRVGRYIGDLNGEGTAGYLCGSGEVLIVRSLGERLQRPAPVTIRGHVSRLGGSAGDGERRVELSVEVKDDHISVRLSGCVPCEGSHIAVRHVYREVRRLVVVGAYGEVCHHLVAHRVFLLVKDLNDGSIGLAFFYVHFERRGSYVLALVVVVSHGFSGAHADIEAFSGSQFGLGPSEGSFGLVSSYGSLQAGDLFRYQREGNRSQQFAEGR